MLKREIQAAMQVLGAGELLCTAEQMNQRLGHLYEGYAPLSYERMATFAAGQRALDEQLCEMEHWLDGRFAQQMALLESGQAILMEKAEEMAAMQVTPQPSANVQPPQTALWMLRH